MGNALKLSHKKKYILTFLYSVFQNYIVFYAFVTPFLVASKRGLTKTHNKCLDKTGEKFFGVRFATLAKNYPKIVMQKKIMCDPQ